jgi:hypothetical protein
MKKIELHSYLFVIVLSLMLVFAGCKSNNSTGPSGPHVSAKISGDVTLDFSTTIANVKLSRDSVSNYILRVLTATMYSGGTTYLLSLAVKDNGNKSFDVSKNDASVTFSVIGTANSTFSYFADGEVTLTQLDDNNWVGSFHFDASNADSTKHVKVNNGSLDVHK